MLGSVDVRVLILEFLEFAFYVNRSGWRARPQFMVHWEGYPTAFGMSRFTCCHKKDHA